MHAHVRTGRKLSLKRDQRQALLHGLVASLILHESIETTEAKAKEVAPLAERLITRAKLGGVYNQRLIIKTLSAENVVQKLMYELAPAFKERTGGYTRVVKLGNRRGDNAPLAQVSLVLPEKLTPAVPKAEKAATDNSKSEVKEPATKKSAKKEAAK